MFPKYWFQDPSYRCDNIGHNKGDLNVDKYHNLVC